MPTAVLVLLVAYSAVFRWVLWLTSFCLGHLKNLPKEQQRFILRHFNFAIQVFTLFSYLLRGNLSLQHLPYMGILILSVSLPAMLGARLFYKISERQLNESYWDSYLLRLLFMYQLPFKSVADF